MIYQRFLRPTGLILFLCLVLGLAVPVNGQDQPQAPWFKATEVANNVWVIDDHGGDNVYLVAGKTQALLIDTGLGIGDLTKFVGTLTSLPLTVVNTHGHPDHAGGNNQFKVVAAHPSDFDGIKFFSSKDYLKNANQKVLTGPAIPGIVSMADVEAAAPAELRPIKEGDVFDLGDRKLEVIETPGHTPGSVCLLDRGAKLLFTGDDNNTLVWLFLQNSLPLDQYLKTLEKLQARSAEYDTILPGHGTPLPKDFIDDQIGCVRSILDGSCQSEPYKSFAGDGRLCKYKRAAVAFDPEKLRSNK